MLARVDAIRANRPPYTGQHPTMTSAPRAASLTTRELDVLDLIAVGDSNSEIGDKLQISPKTVMTHVRHLLFKLQAANRAHAVACGFRTGLL
jgi:DNA-binding NarL/FixJ family response regulator